jgi:hypothetical protein
VGRGPCQAKVDHRQGLVNGSLEPQPWTWVSAPFSLCVKRNQRRRTAGNVALQQFQHGAGNMAG